MRCNNNYWIGSTKLHKEVLAKVAARQFPAPAVDASSATEEKMWQRSVALSGVSALTHQYQVAADSNSVNETPEELHNDVSPKDVFRTGPRDENKHSLIKLISSNIHDAAEVLQRTRHWKILYALRMFSLVSSIHRLIELYEKKIWCKNDCIIHKQRVVGKSRVGSGRGCGRKLIEYTKKEGLHKFHASVTRLSRFWHIRMATQIRSRSKQSVLYKYAHIFSWSTWTLSTSIIW